MKRILLSLLLMNMSLPVYAGYLTGNKLLSDCRGALTLDDGHDVTRKEIAKSGICIGYIMAVNDDHDIHVAWGTMEAKYCVPDSASPDELISIVVEYMEANPEQLQSSAAGLVNNSLYVAFPCN